MTKKSDAFFNKVQLRGNLAADPTTTKDGKYIRMTVATTEYFTANDKSGKEVEAERTQWHNILVAGKDAIDAAKTLKKGALVAVTGSLGYSSITSFEGYSAKDATIYAYAVTLVHQKQDGSKAQAA